MGLQYKSITLGKEINSKCAFISSNFSLFLLGFGESPYFQDIRKIKPVVKTSHTGSSFGLRILPCCTILHSSLQAKTLLLQLVLLKKNQKQLLNYGPTSCLPVISSLTLVPTITAIVTSSVPTAQADSSHNKLCPEGGMVAITGSWHIGHAICFLMLPGIIA
jgi:hypothetical protein